MQLRTLGHVRRDNRNAPYLSFLLAYQYRGLCINAPDSALTQLQNVLRVNPKDQLAAKLITVLKTQQNADDRPKPRP